MNPEQDPRPPERGGAAGGQEEASARTRLASVAREYSRLVTEWFRAGEQALRDKEQEFLIRAGMDASRVKDDIAGITDTVQVLRTHQHLIYDRLSNGIDLALQARGSAEQRRRSLHLIEEALLGMDRSIAAWLALKDSFPDLTDSILSLLVHLDRLRRGTLAQFPDARKTA
jgi:hypothetical protein